MEISGQYHTLAALTPEKEFQVPNGEEAGWAPVPVWKLWRGENRLTLPAIKPTAHDYTD
jgi:hypothetical protein